MDENNIKSCDQLLYELTELKEKVCFLEKANKRLQELLMNTPIEHVNTLNRIKSKKD